MDHQEINPISGAKLHNIGARYEEASLSKLDFPPEVNEEIFNWVNKHSGILVFESNPGTGKTYMAAALCNLWHQQRLQIRYFTAESYLEKLRHSISMNHDAMAAVSRICEVDYLIMDDLGSNLGNTDWQRSVIFKTIDVRYTSRLPTLILTNLNNSQITELYTERTASRIYASENTHIRLIGEDRRKNGQ